MRRALHRLSPLIFVLAITAPSFAQLTAPEPVAKSYVMPYFIVGLGIALGLVSVCRVSKRQREVRKPD